MSVIIGSDAAAAYTNNSIANGNGGTRWVGVLITVVANGTIDKLCVLDNNSDGAFKFALYRADGTLVRTTAPVTAAVGVRSGACAPLDVSIGQQYILGRYVSAGYGRFKGHTANKARFQIIGSYAEPAANIAPTVDAGTPEPLMWAEGTIASYEITSVNAGAGVVVGSANNAYTTKDMTALESLKIGDVSVTALAAIVGSGTFTMPEPVDGVVYPQYGNVDAIAKDVARTSIGYGVVLRPKTTQAFKSLTTLNLSGAGKIAWHVQQAGYVPQVGDTITYSTAASLGVPVNQVEEDGTILTDLVGKQIMWYRFAATGIVRFVEVITQGNGQVVSVKFFKAVPFAANYFLATLLKAKSL